MYVVNRVHFHPELALSANDAEGLHTIVIISSKSNNPDNQERWKKVREMVDHLALSIKDSKSRVITVCGEKAEHYPSIISPYNFQHDYVVVVSREPLSDVETGMLISLYEDSANLDAQHHHKRFLELQKLLRLNRNDADESNITHIYDVNVWDTWDDSEAKPSSFIRFRNAYKLTEWITATVFAWTGYKGSRIQNTITF